MFLSLSGTPLAELAGTLGWFSVSTDLHGGAQIRTVVYVDGDVTTKLIGTHTIDNARMREHFCEIERQGRLVRTRLRNIVLTITGLWLLVATAVAATAHNRAGLLAAAAILVPLAITA